MGQAVQLFLNYEGIYRGTLVVSCSRVYTLLYILGTGTWLPYTLSIYIKIPKELLKNKYLLKFDPVLPILK